MFMSFALAVACIFVVTALYVLLWFFMENMKKYPPIVIPLYNDGEEFLDKIEMIINDNPKSEVIIVDIAGDDETLKKIKILRSQYPKISYRERKLTK